tara:strand:- start:5508 stop:6329 length:822 start_codon:yes stop_codon:yes gene_type:complete
MLITKNLSILIDDNPISRAYIQFLIDNEIFLETPVYLIKNNLKILPYSFTSKLNFRNNNLYPLKYLQIKKVIQFIDYVENFFQVRKNFLKDMYQHENIYNISKKIEFVYSKSINSNSVLSLLNKKLIYINTSNQIYKEILKTNIKFVHIHPATLPDIRGADGSLYMYQVYKSYGATSFFMSKNIDQGEIISQYTEKFDNFKFDLLSTFDIKNIYRLWFSFVDPLIRLIEFKKIILNDMNYLTNQNQIKTNNKGSYFSYMSNDQINIIFSKLFK